MGEKDITNSLIARNYRFLAFMDANGRNIKAIAAFAVSIIIIFPRGSAKPGAIHTEFAMGDFGFNITDYLILS